MTALGSYCASLIIVQVAGAFTADFNLAGHPPVSYPHWFARWDTREYAAIAKDGYWYNPDARSPVVFYPAYPLSGRLVIWSTGLDAGSALLVVAHLSLLAALVVFLAYLHTRCPAAGWHDWALAALVLWPTTCFCRFAHTESPFLLLTLLAMFGMQRGWRPVAVALIIGLATATRGPGLALVPVFALYLWQRARSVAGLSQAGGAAGVPRATPGLTGGGAPAIVSRVTPGFSDAGTAAVVPRLTPGLTEAGYRHGEPLTPVARRFLASAVWLLPLSCWGLLAYMAFLYVQFGDPLLFATAQQPRFLRQPPPTWEHVVALATLEPVRSVYDPESDAYWGSDKRPPTIHSPLFSLHFANPIYFVLCGALLAVGAWNKWLDSRELLLGALLLLIPYAALGYQNWMISQGRFAAVVFPAYIVMGRILHALPVAVSVCLLGLCAWFLGIYSALFAAGYRIY